MKDYFILCQHSDTNLYQLQYLQSRIMKPQKQEQKIETNFTITLTEHVPREFVETISQLASSKKWDLKSKKKSYEDLQIIFTYMPPQNKVQYILLQWNQMPRILQLFMHGPFSNLKSLTLGGNNIESIEAILRINFFHLQQLILWNNKITNLRSVRKMQVPHLRVLDLSSNLIINNDSWSEWHNPQLQTINLQKNRFGSINSMVKMESQDSNLRVDIINNGLPSIIRCLPKEGKKIATYFYIRSFIVVYR